jgi:hypothetical protein
MGGLLQFGAANKSGCGSKPANLNHLDAIPYRRLPFMADALNDRRKGFEEKFRHDQDLQFKVSSRRNKLLGLWLGERFGLGGDKLAEYASSVVIADLAKPGDDDVIGKVMADIKEHNVAISDADVRAKLAEFAVTAKDQLMAEQK